MSELGTCLDSESIGAFAEGGLRGEALDVVREHLLTCDECLSAVGAANRAIAELGTGKEPLVETIAFRPRRTGRWLAAAAAAMLPLAIVGGWFQMHPSVERLLAPLAADVTEKKQRPTEGRLAELPYATHYNPRGSSEDDRPDLKSLNDANKVLEKIGDPRSANEQQAAAVAMLIRKEGDDRKTAVELLEQAAKARPTPAVLSDLAAARYALGNYTGALQAAEAARRLDPKFAPALFNRALSLEQIDPAKSAEAIKAWQDYLAVDPQGDWAKEAKSKKAKLQDWLQ